MSKCCQNDVKIILEMNYQTCKYTTSKIEVSKYISLTYIYTLDVNVLK